MIRVIAGLILGIVIARNAEPMPHPVQAAVGAAFLAGLLLAWAFGRRDKASAVAVAVASAQAAAAAEAEASAEAIAQAAVQVYLGHDQSVRSPAVARNELTVPVELGRIVAEQTT